MTNNHDEMYTVPKLEDYSPEVLDREIAQLLQVLEGDANSVQTSNDWKEFRDRWLARKKDRKSVV